MLKKCRSVFLFIAIATGMVFAADDDAKTQNRQALDTKIQTLKQEVIELNRDLLALEEELLFPANTQVAVFLSMDVGTLFQLD